jgi:sugar phosphate isomerase/epimerase
MASRLQLAGSVWCYFVAATLRRRKSVSTAVRSILALEEDLGVEVWASRSPGDVRLSTAERRELISACSDARSVSVHVRGQYWVWNPRGLREEIDFAASLGARVVVVHPGSLGLISPETRLDLPEIRRIGRYALESSVTLALENTENSAWALDRLLDDVGDKPEATGIGVCIDVGHAHISTDLGRTPIRAYLERYRGPLRHVHLHDTFGEEDRHLVIGRGTVAWRTVVDALQGIGFEGAAVFEVQDPALSPADALRASVQTIRSLEEA